ncbi:hypothetical protein LTR53_016762, partial [Teratosphaeriaceae sp. CCFEE 6253]
SVRPPLSPLAEAELRAACAYVLQNFKPSHIVYDEQHGGASNQKAQLDYAAIKGSVHRETEQSPPPPVHQMSRSRTQEAVATIIEGEDAEVITSDKFKYKPNATVEDLFKGEPDARTQRRKSAIMRAELLMAQPAKTIVAVARDRSDSHLRSVSSPVPASLVPPKHGLAERPRTVPRTDSLETTGSTPQTDNTDYPWSEKASTAMTSAAETPARGSKRTSSHALEGSSTTKSGPPDADWMRQELEKHKKAQEERKQEDVAVEEPGHEESDDTTPTQSSTHTATPVAVRVPARKPVPHSRTASKQESTQLGSAKGARASPERRRAAEAATEVQRKEAELPVFAPPPAPSRQAPERPPSRAPSRARSVSRRVKDYVRSASAHRPTRADDGSRPPSRSGQAARQVKDYFRPSMDAGSGSRAPSTDVAREGSRAMSIDSFHTSSSELPAPGEQGGSINKWRTWKTFHRRDRSQTDPYTSRPGTAGSTTEGRGRSHTREGHHAPPPAQQQQQQQQAGSGPPPVDLNRNLPPLPGLDQWKSNEAEPEPASTQAAPPPPPPPHAAPAPPPHSAPTISPSKAHRSQRSRHEKPPLSNEPELGERDEILLARMGSPTAMSRKPSKAARVPVPAVPTGAPPAPPGSAAVLLSANFSSRDDFGYEHLSPQVSQRDTATTTASNTASLATEAKKWRRRSRTVDAATTPPTPSTPAQPLPALDRANFATAGKAQLVSFSRAAAGGLSRKTSRVQPHTQPRPLRPGPGVRAVTDDATTMSVHSRQVSESPSAGAGAGGPGWRKASVDAAAATAARGRGGEGSGISATPPPAVQPVVVGGGEGAKGKGKWWKRGKGGEKPGSWMDQVVKSGARSGTLADEGGGGAEAPVVRY